jgi:hypothetical protein
MSLLVERWLQIMLAGWDPRRVRKLARRVRRPRAKAEALPRAWWLNLKTELYAQQLDYGCSTVSVTKQLPTETRT